MAASEFLALTRKDVGWLIDRRGELYIQDSNRTGSRDALEIQVAGIHESSGWASPWVISSLFQLVVLCKKQSSAQWLKPPFHDARMVYELGIWTGHSGDGFHAI